MASDIPRRRCALPHNSLGNFPCAEVSCAIFSVDLPGKVATLCPMLLTFRLARAWRKDAQTPEGMTGLLRFRCPDEVDIPESLSPGHRAGADTQLVFSRFFPLFNVR